MPDDIERRILQDFEVRLEGNPNVSPATAEALLTDQRHRDFGDDDEILNELVEDQ